MDTNVQVSVECTLFLAGSGTGVGMTSITGIGTAGAPTFTEVPGVQNVNLNLSKNESDVSVRGAGGVKLTRGAQKDISIEITYPYLRADVTRDALFGAWWNGTHVGVAALDGPIASASSKGIAMDMEVVACPVPEPIEGVLIQSFTLKPCYPGANSSGTLTRPCVIAGSAGGSLTLG